MLSQLRRTRTSWTLCGKNWDNNKVQFTYRSALAATVGAMVLRRNRLSFSPFPPDTPHPPRGRKFLRGARQVRIRSAIVHHVILCVAELADGHIVADLAFGEPTRRCISPQTQSSVRVQPQRPRRVATVVRDHRQVADGERGLGKATATRLAGPTSPTQNDPIGGFPGRIL